MKAGTVRLSGKDSVEKAFRAIAASCIAQVHANAAGVAGGYDEESLHQMRVGLRRFRSALAVFRKVLQLPPEIVAELDWLTEELGHARDWDVMAGATLPSLEGSMAAGRALLDVTQAALDAGRTAQVAAAAAVNSQRYTRLMLLLGRWLIGKRWRQQVPGRSRLTAPAGLFARAALRSAHKKLTSAARRWPTARRKPATAPASRPRRCATPASSSPRCPAASR